MDKINNIIFQRIIQEEKGNLFNSIFFTFAFSLQLHFVPYFAIVIYLISVKYIAEHLNKLNTSEFKLSDEYLLFLPLKKRELIKGYFKHSLVTILFIEILLFLCLGIWSLLFASYEYFAHSTITFVVAPAVALVISSFIQLIAVISTKQKTRKIVYWGCYILTGAFVIFTFKENYNYLKLTDNQSIATIICALIIYFIVYKITVKVSRFK